MSVRSFFSSAFAGRGSDGSPAAPMSAAPVLPAPVPLSPIPSLSDGHESASHETGIVLDALGSLMQYYAKFAFDTDVRSADEARGLAHGWMLHATMGAPRPGHPNDRPSAGVQNRDWKGVTHYFGEQRRDEGRYVVGALDDLRSVIWSFVGAMHQVVVDEQEEARAAGDQLHRMRRAVESDSTGVIKREALAVVGEMEKLLSQRKERQRDQFTALAEQVKSLGHELEDARRESGTDSLTGLANRKAFDQYVTRSIDLHSLLGQPACLLMIDADNFKQINDTFGHSAGDVALRRLAGTLASTFLRRVDFVCRYGGDEFAVLLQETRLGDALQLGDRLCRQMQHVEAAGGADESHPPRVSLSIGVAELRIGDDAASWVRRADAALYSAKRAGRSQVSSITAE